MKGQSEEERVRVVAKYKDWLWKQIAEKQVAKNNLLVLSGKKLCCYCAKKLCHGDILKETVELLISNEAEFDNKVKAIRDNNIKLKF